MNSTNTRKITRILPGLKANYEVVSMPAWAWESLEDYMSFYGRPDVPSLLSDFKDSIPPSFSLSELLENIAAVHQHFMMQFWHSLENDNDPFGNSLPSVKRRHGPQIYPQGRSYAKAMKLFGFLPHATSFETVLYRRKSGDQPV